MRVTENSFKPSINLTEQLRGTASAMASAASNRKAQEAGQELDLLIEALEYAKKSSEGLDADSENLIRCKIAVLALELQQYALPAINHLIDQSFHFCGGAAIREVCKAHTVEGRVFPSRFVMPEGYEGIIGRVSKALRR